MLMRRSRQGRRWTRAAAVAVLVGVACASTSGEALGQSTISSPGDHPPYGVELEPHLAFGVADPPGAGSGSGFGAGLRATFEIAHTGFVGSINDSVAIGVGADVLHYTGDGDVEAGTCRRFVPGPAGTNVCVEVAQAGGRSNYAFFPVVMQWNFWLARRGSIFVEPGLALYWLEDASLGVVPTLSVGGRLQLTDRVSLTLRLGYPTIALGVSFLL